MNAFFGGLLQGVSKGVADVGSAMFQDAIQAKKEERLAKIADRNYARDRQNQLDDIAADRRFQKELVEDAQGFKTSEREAGQGFATDEREASQTFQLEVISDKQAFDEKTANTNFGRQVALQTLDEQSRKRLLAEAQKYPSSPLGKLIQDRDNATTEDEKAIFNRQIAMSQVFQSTDVLGNTRFIMPNFATDNRSITSTTEVGSVASPEGSATNGASGAVDQVKLQELIEKVKAEPADANGMINMGQGLMLKEEMLRNLEAKLTGTAGPPGLLSSAGALLAANALSF